MPLRQITTCRACRAAIFWARTRADKPMPVDAQPVDGGNLLVDDAVHPPVVRYVDPIEAMADGDITFRSHFVTCRTPRQRRRED